jgi:CelD/BcsL family acetyltransferase involved in cellulose biosynthesis
VFHTPAWLDALRHTYGYEPFVLTTSVPGRELTNGLVFCRINSHLTGRRLVSLPFSDHCQPLVDSPADLQELVSFSLSKAETRKREYVELRPRTPLDQQLERSTGLTPSASFCYHVLDLRANLDDLYRNFHKSCVQRKIQRADREALGFEEGRSESLLRKFYRLLLLTRRRHQLPPQPVEWFRNLIDCFGEKLVIRVAFKGKDAIATILTLSHKNSVVYKYGCSDARFHNLGGMPFLFWQTIQQGKKKGAEELDFGRSELDNPGLIAFKDHWGGAKSTLTYYRYPRNSRKEGSQGWRVGIVRKAISRLPDVCLETAGSLLYKHVG